MEEPNPDYTDIGPGLNAQNIRSRGWLEESRVWTSVGGFDATVTLRPLHWRERDQDTMSRNRLPRVRS